MCTRDQRLHRQVLHDFHCVHAQDLVPPTQACLPPVHTCRCVPCSCAVCQIFRGEKYNECVDVYSFAMALYEMLSGAPCA